MFFTFVVVKEYQIYVLYAQKVKLKTKDFVGYNMNIILFLDKIQYYIFSFLER